MKRKILVIVIAAFLIAAPQLMFAQPHPNSGFSPNAPGGPTNNPVGPSAPIGNGTFLLLTLAMAYAVTKVHKERENTSEE
ncbi:MAG: hypothetical protein ACOYN4_05900 [Bacteroidales bacterium]